MTFITRYLAPASAAAMTTMLMSPQAIADAVAGMHESMRAEGGRLLQAQDRARRLLLGVDDFADVWRTTPADTDGSPIDVMADVIAGHAKGVGPERMTGWPGPVLLEYLQRIAEADIGHPLVAHRDVLRQACHDMDQPEPDWSDLDAYVTSTQLLAAGPQLGQPCAFYPADGSEPRDAVVTHVWGPTMINLQFQDNGAPATATSVQVLARPAPDHRYYCVLRPTSVAG